MTKMNAMFALAVVEGLEQVDDDEIITAAWQYLIDSKMAWTLPGRIGRMAAKLIEEGVCNV